MATNTTPKPVAPDVDGIINDVVKLMPHATDTEVAERTEAARLIGAVLKPALDIQKDKPVEITLTEAELIALAKAIHDAQNNLPKEERETLKEVQLSGGVTNIAEYVAREMRGRALDLKDNQVSAADLLHQKIGGSGTYFDHTVDQIHRKAQGIRDAEQRRAESKAETDEALDVLNKLKASNEELDKLIQAVDPAKLAEMIKDADKAIALVNPAIQARVAFVDHKKRYDEAADENAKKAVGEPNEDAAKKAEEAVRKELDSVRKDMKTDEEKKLLEKVLQVAADNYRTNTAGFEDDFLKNGGKQANLGDLGKMLGTEFAAQEAGVSTDYTEKSGAAVGGSGGGKWGRAIAAATAVVAGVGAFKVGGNTVDENGQPKKSSIFAKVTKVVLGAVAVGAVVAAVRGGNLQGLKDAKGIDKIGAVLHSISATGAYARGR